MLIAAINNSKCSVLIILVLKFCLIRSIRRTMLVFSEVDIMNIF